MDPEIDVPSTPAPDEAAPRLSLVNETDDGRDAGDPAGEPLTPLEEKQQLLAHHVRLVARGLSNGLFVYGATGGLGKSRTIHDTLCQERADVRLINSHITALSLYETLYFNRTGKVIVLDDCDNLYGDLKVLGLLRSALWGQGDKRVVTYTSSQLPAELPNSHVFESRLVLTANVLPKRNAAFRAVLSRIDVFDLSASSEEVLALMRKVAARGFGPLTPEECQEVVTFIERHADGRQLSMRLLEPSFRKVEYARSQGIPWEPLVQSQLQTLGKTPAVTPVDLRESERRRLLQAVERHPESVQEQQAEWCRATGKSRASFFRALARLRAEGK